MRKPLLLVLAALAAAALGCSKDKEPVRADPAGAAPSSAAVTAAATATAPTPPAIDLSFVEPLAADIGLSPREENELATVLTRIDAPCASQAVSVAQCLSEHRACPDCARAARYLANGVHQGWPPQYAHMAFAARFDPSEVRDLPVDGSPTKGPASAAVSIVEFGSYVCPHCAAEAPKLDALQKAHPKDVRLVFKPAWSSQNVAQVAATRAALAAAAQGKFWEMHALLFANQPKFDPDAIDGYAKSIGLDLNKLHADMAGPAVAEQMRKDLAAAAAAKVDSLPSIWINGRAYLSFEDLEGRVRFELSGK